MTSTGVECTVVTEVSPFSSPVMQDKVTVPALAGSRVVPGEAGNEEVTYSYRCFLPDVAFSLEAEMCRYARWGLVGHLGD